jgi:hypothetical protein
MAITYKASPGAHFYAFVKWIQSSGPRGGQIPWAKSANLNVQDGQCRLRQEGGKNLRGKHRPSSIQHVRKWMTTARMFRSQKSHEVGVQVGNGGHYWSRILNLAALADQAVDIAVRVARDIVMKQP